MAATAAAWTSCLALGLAAWATGCAPDRAPPLRVGGNPFPGYEPLFLAEDLGYLDGADVRAVMYPDTSEVLRAFRNGALQAALVTGDEMLQLRADGIDARVILVADFSNGADVILARPPARSMADLAGKRVGLEAGALGAVVLSVALDDAGMTAADVQTVSVDLADHAVVYASGAVDTVVTFDPQRARILAAGGANQVYDSRRHPKLIVDVLVVPAPLLDTRADALQGLVDAFFRARAYMDDHPAEAATRAALRAHMTPEEVQSGLLLLDRPGRAENAVLLGPSASGLGPSLERLSAMISRAKLLPREVETEGLLDDRFVVGVGR